MTAFGGARRTFTILVVAVIAATLAITLGTPLPAEAARKTYNPKTAAYFNVPRSAPAVENRLEEQIITAVRNTPRGATIKMVMFSYDRWQVTDALLAAHKRGVNVQVIINNHELMPAARRLRNVLGKRAVKVTETSRAKKANGRVVTHRRTVVKARPSFFYQCLSACRGDGDVQHSKFVLFSKTGAAKNLVMLGSLNMKYNGTHNQFNDLVVLPGRTALYRDLDRVFREMRSDRNRADSYRDINYGPNEELFVLPFPRTLATARTRWSAYRDPIAELLRPVKCFGAATPSGRTAIRVNMHAWDKSRGVMIANLFRDLYAKGCDVKIMVGFAGKDVQGVFKRPTARGQVPVRSTGFDTNFDGEIDLFSHTKYFTVNGNYQGKNNAKVVVTGSSNYQNGGQYGDELIIKLLSPGLFYQYIDNWNSVWHGHTHGFSWGGGDMGIGVNGRGTAMYPDNLRAPSWRSE